MNDALARITGGPLASLADRGLKKRIRVVEGAADSFVNVAGHRCIQLSSNNYLGLTTHPQVRTAAAEALNTLGTGAGAVMPIAGTMMVHKECEKKLAELKHTEAAILMPSGYTANVGTVAALMSHDDLIISDELNHASIIDGIRLAGADKRIYRHADMSALEASLRDASKYRNCIIVTDGVFSMDGDIAPLPEIVALKEKYGVILMVDDAHATGVLGKNGGGTVEYFSLQGRVEIQIGTLSKALGAIGGFVAAEKSIVDLLTQKARPFLFSAALPPSVVATVQAAIEIMKDEPWHLKALWENTRFFKDELNRLKFNTGNSMTPITPIIIGDSRLAAKMSERLEEEGILASEVIFPMVPEKLARIRTIVTASHTREQLAEAVRAFEKIGNELGIIH